MSSHGFLLWIHFRNHQLHDKIGNTVCKKETHVQQHKNRQSIWNKGKLPQNTSSAVFPLKNKTSSDDATMFLRRSSGQLKKEGLDFNEKR